MTKVIYNSILFMWDYREPEDENWYPDEDEEDEWYDED